MKEELRAQTFVTDDDDDRRQTMDSTKTIYLPLKGGGGDIITML